MFNEEGEKLPLSVDVQTRWLEPGETERHKVALVDELLTFFGGSFVQYVFERDRVGGL